MKWSHKCDNAEFELSRIRKKSEHFEKALKTIRDAFYTDGETDKEKIDDLKAIAFNALMKLSRVFFRVAANGRALAKAGKS